MAALGDRSLFPTLEAKAYLNHAAISPPSVPVIEAVHRALSASAARGVGAFLPSLREREGLRADLAALIGAEPADIAFSDNTTRGVSHIALCFPWRRGDRVVLFDGEFPANVTPWQRAAELFDLEIVWLDRPRAGAPHVILEQIDAALARGARMVAASAVQFQTGLRMPLSDIARRCHERGAELFVDAIQACGVVPIDVRRQGIDYLSCGSHKWLMGTEGLAFLYVAPSRITALRPYTAGWTSHEEGLGFLFEGPGLLRYDRPLRRRADVFEGGMHNTLGVAGLRASVGLIRELGVERIFEHVTRYLDALEPELVARGFESERSPLPEERSGILSLRPPPGIDVVELHHRIEGVSCSIPDGRLRFAPHWPNALDELDAVLAAVDQALGR